jgi:hypothetical protein
MMAVAVAIQLPAIRQQLGKRNYLHLLQTLTVQV